TTARPSSLRPPSRRTVCTAPTELRMVVPEKDDGRRRWSKEFEASSQVGHEDALRINTFADPTPGPQVGVHGVNGACGGPAVLGQVQASTGLQHPLVATGEQASQPGQIRGKIDRERPAGSGKGQRRGGGSSHPFEDPQEGRYTGQVRGDPVEGFLLPQWQDALVLDGPRGTVGTVPVPDGVQG